MNYYDVFSTLSIAQATQRFEGVVVFAVITRLAAR